MDGALQVERLDQRGQIRRTRPAAVRRLSRLLPKRQHQGNHARLTPTPNKETLPPALFRFYAWNTAAAEPTADVLLPFTSGALTDADVKRVARIEITYRAKPRNTDNRASTVFYNEVAVRTVDPNAQAGELNVPCL